MVDVLLPVGSDANEESDQFPKEIHSMEHPLLEGQILITRKELANEVQHGKTGAYVLGQSL